MSHAQNMSDISNLSDLSDLSATLSKPESVISFNKDVYLAMQNAAVSTVTYVGQARKIIEQLSTNQYRWIITPPSVHNMDASRDLDAMLACPDIHEQVNLARTWFMYLLWPCVWDGPYMHAGVNQGVVTLIGMSKETIKNMERLVDNPSNCMMLQRDLHDNFDKLKIYLEQMECSSKKTSLSRILHMSSASEVFAQILDKYDGAAGGNIGSLKAMEIRHFIDYLVSRNYMKFGALIVLGPPISGVSQDW
ncbi:hypothetical protein BD769DRAFT_1394512 [Suillus cothurnatus]|nr:hypothetical protein BD769DRAFT_1394512 [Suillus cothurnatus]